MEEKEFDVFVIGSGIAGQTVAETCAKAGKKVAIVDNREFGGTCANRGCDPKKVLMSLTEILENAHNLKKKDILKSPKFNWKKLQKFKKKFTAKVPESTEKKLKNLGITLYHQSPKFLDERTVLVEGKKIIAKHYVIATGYEPRKFNFDGHKHLKSSDEFLNLKALPKHITFMGAGYVGMELAHIAVRAGVKVTVIDSGERPLSAFDKDLVKELTHYSKKLGIDYIFKAKITSLQKLRKNYKITYVKGGKKQTFKSRMVFNTAGRVPAISQLDLKKANVLFSDAGIETNAFLQSKSNTAVYACGDVSANGLPLTPLSGLEGHIAAKNILEGNQKKLSYPVIPSVVFTLPNLASVGYSEEEAQARFKNIVVKQGVANTWFNAKRINAPVYSYKILLNERTDEIVGAHLLGPEAAETINIFAMAINAKMTARDLKTTIFTYPSWVNDVKSMV
jgi:glutathione reductase (NADPH)